MADSSRRRALTAALGNATALGLGFAYTRRWHAFGLNLFFTGLIGLCTWQSDPPAPFWFALAGLVAAATALGGWRAGTREAPPDEDDPRPRASGPLPGRFWLPVFVAILVCYAGVLGWFVVDAHRLFDAQTEAHRGGDCGTAFDLGEDLNWGHQAFAPGRHEAVSEQAYTCELYLTAHGFVESDSGAADFRLRQAITYLEWYADRPDAHLRERAASEIERLRSELVITQLRTYVFGVFELPEDIAELQGVVEAQPGSPLSERTLAELDATVAQWEADVHGEAVCEVASLLKNLFPAEEVPDVMTEPGPIADPLAEADESLGASAAFGCAQMLIDSSEAVAERDPERSEREMEWALNWLQRVVEVYPDAAEAAGAEELLRALGD